MRFSKKVLESGLRLITVPMKDNPTVTVLVMVEAGSKYEAKSQSGISHFLEHMCFKGTAARPTSFAIARELDAIGAQYNAFTSTEFTGYYAKAQAKNLPEILDVVTDLYQNQLLDPAEMEKEKGVISEEISMYEEAPQRHVHDLFTRLLYGDAPAGWNIAGTKESVRAFSKADLLAYREAHYVSGATTVVVAGAFDEADLIAEVEKKFAAMHRGPKHPKTKVEEAQRSPALSLQFREIDQAHLVLGVRAFDAFSPKAPAATVLASLLGGGMSSRLFQKLRGEMGVAYSVSAYEESFTDHGYLAVSAGVDHTRLPEVLKAILGEFRRAIDEPVSADELMRTKDHIIGSLSLELESSDSLAHFYGMQEILRKPLLLPEDFSREIHAVTAGDIQAVAREIFADANLNLALIGQFRDEQEILPLLTLGQR